MFQRLLLFSWLIASGPVPAGCNDALAQEGARAAVEHWRGWSVVMLGDLRPDDQDLFQKHWGIDACPGIVVGHFVSPSQNAVAVLLQRGEGKSRVEMVVVGVPASRGGMQWHTASNRARSVSASVISVVQPKKYKEWEEVDRRIVETGRDGIMYEQIEDGALLLVYRAGRFESVVVSF